MSKCQNLKKNFILNLNNIRINHMKKCYKCGTEWVEKHTPNFRDECEKCLTPLCVCKNCKFYRDDSHEWCAETEARSEKPRDRDVANKCSYFLMGNSSFGGAIGNSEDAKKKLASLFADNISEEPQAEADWMKVDDNENNNLDDIFT